MTAAQDKLLPDDPKPSGTMTAAILGALIAHYRKPGTNRDGEILIPEPQAPNSARRADLVRISSWASRGSGIDVHEIKASRADWLRERDDPAKADAWWPYCTRFWITAPPGIVAPPELPEGWGLMELPRSGRRFKVTIPAAEKNPKVTVSLLTELLKRADNMRLKEIDALRDQHQRAMFEAQERIRLERGAGELPYETAQRLDLLKRIEDAIGVPLVRYSKDFGRDVSDMTPDELAAYMADAREHVSAQRFRQDIEHRAGRLERAAEYVLEQVRES